MKTVPTNQRLQRLAVTAVTALFLVATAGWAATVQTVGGGPRQGNPSAAGYTDGDTAEFSQFNGPSGLAFDSAGNFLYVADRTNDVVRRLDLAGNRTSTFVSNYVDVPVDVALDGADAVYVLNRAQGHNGYVSKYNKYRNYLGPVATSLTNPTALTIDGNTNLYVTELGGAIKRITRTGAQTNVARVSVPGVQLQGIALTADGNLIVSDAGNHALWHVHLISGSVSLFTGGAGAGDSFGEAGFAQFNRPEHIARAGDNRFVVADRGNHRVVQVDAFGTVTPLYGVDSNLWVYFPDPSVFPGWWDGEACEEQGCAEAREPVGVAVSPAGEVYTSEYYYHLIRMVSGTELTGPGTSPSTPLFNHPAGLATDSTGSFIFIADRANNAVRRLDLASSSTLTFASGTLDQPVALAVDAADNVYVLNQGNGTIVKYNRFANLLPWSASGLVQPTAMAMDGMTNLYVSELNGAIKRVSAAGTVTVVASVNEPGVQLRGIAVMDDGMIVVSDAGHHAVWLVDPATSVRQVLTGNNGPGSNLGTKPYVQLNRPQQLAKAGGDLLVLADQGNHRLVAVDRYGTATNLSTFQSVVFYGRPGDPVQPEDSRFVPLASPLGVLVAPNGDVFSSETISSIVRRTQGTGLNGPGQGSGSNPGGTGIVLTPPVMSPNSGYYPMGQLISVSSPNPVYYTTDGTDPTTNSLQVPLDGNLGTLFWNDPTNDLTRLRLRAISGTNASAVVSGVPAPVNQIGVTRDVNAGIGSTVLVPVVMNLRTNDTVRTVQYRVEIEPLNNAKPVLPQFGAISISSNDFVTVVGASLPNTIGQYTAMPYKIPNPSQPGEVIPGGLAISVVGTNANFMVKKFGTVAMLVVPLPATAAAGDQYRISMNNVSATSDGQQTPVSVTPMPNRLITISNISYVVGDSAGGYWYNAGDFGDGDLNNNDVNSAFYASLGVHTPFTFSDVFDGMDAFPPDEPGFLGGDGEIRFLDWQLILQRSLRLDTNNYKRTWSAGGTRVTETTLLGASRSKRAKDAPPLPPPGSVWVRQAALTSQSLVNAVPTGFYYRPVYVKVAPGSSLAGLSFRVALEAGSGAPPIQGLSWTPVPGMPTPIQGAGLAANELLCGWPLVPSPSFVPALQGSNLIGHISFTVPLGAQPGQFYTLRFYNADGAPDIQTQYDLECVPTFVWVGTPAQHPDEVLSDQWKTNFFGSLTNVLADGVADGDGDGVPNWQEFLAGTDPTNFRSRLQLLDAERVESPAGLVLRWLTAPGKRYLIERSSSPIGSAWTVVADGLLGDGTVQSCIDTQGTGATRFYRIRLQP